MKIVFHPAMNDDTGTDRYRWGWMSWCICCILWSSKTTLLGISLLLDTSGRLHVCGLILTWCLKCGMKMREWGVQRVKMWIKASEFWKIPTNSATKECLDSNDTLSKSWIDVFFDRLPSVFNFVWDAYCAWNDVSVRQRWTHEHQLAQSAII